MTEKPTWMNSLPVGWQLRAFKFVGEYLTSNVDKVPSELEEVVRLCNYTDVYKNDYIHLRLDFMQSTATQEEIDKYRLLVGDVVITKDSEAWDDIAVPALVIEDADDLVCGYHLAILRANPKFLDGRFLFRCVQSKVLRQFMELEARGVTRFGLGQDAIGRFPLPIPPLQIQRRIADFLDRETEYIDALIKAKEQMLLLLQEKRAAQISCMLTKGLHDNVSIKDSGVEWLGEIPDHWGIERAKRLFDLREEHSENGEEELLSVSHITGVTSRAEKEVNMFKAENMSGYKICKPNDLVINTLWAWMGAMGVAQQEGIVSPAYHVYTPKAYLTPDYVNLLCRAKPFVAEVIRFSKGVWSSRLRLYPESFFDMKLPVPPLSEQEAIVRKTAEYAEQDMKFQNSLKLSILLLLERRSNLITAAVTGKISEVLE